MEAKIFGVACDGDYVYVTGAPSEDNEVCGTKYFDVVTDDNFGHVQLFSNEEKRGRGFVVKIDIV